MKKTKQFASVVAVSAVAVTLLAASAFAESRPSRETRRNADGRPAQTWNRDGGAESRRDTTATENRESFRDRGSETRSSERRSGDENRYDRNRGDNRSYDRRDDNRRDDNRRDESRYDNRRSDNNRSYDNRRNDNRSYDSGRYDRRDHRSYDSRGRQPYYTRGRVSRIAPWNGGYRVWVAGAPYPFFVPEARWRRSPFRLGIEINIGGYYNPLGYYEYYDGPAYTSGDLRGVVESVDYRRGTFVVRDDYSGSFVTGVMRGGDRRFGDLRPGDYVELTGDWTRGVFEAYRVDSVGYYRR